MSKTTEETKEPQTKQITYRIDLNISDYGERTTYMVVTGVPIDLPDNMKDTVKHAAQAQFSNALNSRTFIEVYSLGKSINDEQPLFINMSKVDTVQITSIEELKK